MPRRSRRCCKGLLSTSFLGSPLRLPATCPVALQPEVKCDGYTTVPAGTYSSGGPLNMGGGSVTRFVYLLARDTPASGTVSSVRSVRAGDDAPKRGIGGASMVQVSC